MSDARDNRFNGRYHYFFKSTDFFGGTCHGKGVLHVDGDKSAGTFELDASKSNSWYCPDKKVSFELETEVQGNHEVMFAANWFAGKVRSKARFKQPIDQPDNSFETKIWNGAYNVSGEIKRQPVNQAPERSEQTESGIPKRPCSM